MGRSEHQQDYEANHANLWEEVNISKTMRQTLLIYGKR